MESSDDERDRAAWDMIAPMLDDPNMNLDQFVAKLSAARDMALGFLAANERGDKETETFSLKQLADLGHPVPQSLYGSSLILEGEGDTNASEKARYLKMAADHGEPEAQYHYGILLKNGQGVDVNLEQAAHYFKLAADQGVGNAQLLYALCLAEGQGVDVNLAESARYFKLAADQGMGDIQHLYAICLAEGLGVDVNFAEAARYFKLAADQGMGKGQLYYAISLAEGHGVDVNVAEAARYFKLAADQGIDEAQIRYGMLLQQGRGVDVNFAEAARYFKLAADQGMALAQLRYGMCFRDGEGVDFNFAEAARYFKLAADQGMAPAQYEYGMCLRNGEGVEVDLGKYTYYVKLAADQGLDRAQLHYGACLMGFNDKNNNTTSEEMKREGIHYVKMAVDQGFTPAYWAYAIGLYVGRGIRMNHKEAVKWLNKGLEAGDLDAQWMYGMCLYRGRGIEANCQKALEYIEKSVQQGSTIAKYCQSVCDFERYGRLGKGSRSRQLLEESAKQAYAAAQNLLSLVHLAEHKDFLSAQPFMEATLKGHICAIYNYGVYLLATKEHNAQNVHESFNHFRHVAVQMADGSEYDYVRFLAKAIGCDLKSRWDHLLAEANLNLPESQFIYGKYQYSLGNVSSALEYFRKAACQDHNEAKFVYCMILLNEFGKPLSSVRQYFEEAAHNGVLSAQYNIGILLSELDSPKERLRGARFMQMAAKEILLRRQCELIRVILKDDGSFDEFFYDAVPPEMTAMATDNYMFQQLSENISKLAHMSWADMTRGPAWMNV